MTKKSDASPDSGATGGCPALMRWAFVTIRLCCTIFPMLSSPKSTLDRLVCIEPDTESGLVEPEPGEPLGFRVGVIDETDDDGGHRIYLNPWADRDADPDQELPDQELPAVQDAELVAHRVGEL